MPLQPTRSTAGWKHSIDTRSVCDRKPAQHKQWIAQFSGQHIIKDPSYGPSKRFTLIETQETPCADAYNLFADFPFVKATGLNSLRLRFLRPGGVSFWSVRARPWSAQVRGNGLTRQHRLYMFHACRRRFAPATDFAEEVRRTTRRACAGQAFVLRGC